MKEQDLIRALSNLPQDLLDELDEWQKSGAPLTGRDADDTSSVRTDKPVLTRRRNIEMKQRKDKRTVRPWAWTAGIAAAVVLCTAVAVPVGKEAIRRTEQKNTGYTESEAQPAAGVGEDAAQQKQVPLISNLVNIAGNNENTLAVPENGEVRVLRSMDDLQQMAADTDTSSDKLKTLFQLSKHTFTEYDVLYCAYKGQQLPANYLRYFKEEFTGASLSADGTLTVRYSAFLLTDPQADFLCNPQLYENYYFLYTVPKNELPDISCRKVSVEYTETYFDEELPTEAIQDWKDTKDHNEMLPINGVESLSFFVVNTQEYNDWRNSLPEHLFITWNEKEPLQPEDDDQVYVTEQPQSDKFYAWFWDGYSGNDIPLDGITVDVIRTAADGKQYLTGSGQQDQSTLATVLSEEWLEQAYPEGEALTDPVSGGQIYSDGQPHDVIFIGIPADELPRNAVTQNYHSGTLTPSGKLHIDITALTFLDNVMPLLPEERQFDETKNRYFFITVPAGEIPDAFEPTVSITEYHTDSMPPENLTSPQAVWDWYTETLAGHSWFASVVGNKYIHRIPDEPETVPVQYAYSCLLTETERIETAPGKDAFCDYDTETGRIVLTLPVHNMAAAAALTDLHVSADGVLSLTVHELCQGQADPAEKAWIQWELTVPSGVLPDITGCNMQLSATTDEDAFMQLAGQLIIITKD